MEIGFIILVLCILLYCLIRVYQVNLYMVSRIIFYRDNYTQHDLYFNEKISDEYLHILNQNIWMLSLKAILFRKWEF